MAKRSLQGDAPIRTNVRIDGPVQAILEELGQMGMLAPLGHLCAGTPSALNNVQSPSQRTVVCQSCQKKAGRLTHDV